MELPPSVSPLSSRGKESRRPARLVLQNCRPLGRNLIVHLTNTLSSLSGVPGTCDS